MQGTFFSRLWSDSTQIPLIFFLIFYVALSKFRLGKISFDKLEAVVIVVFVFVYFLSSNLV